MAQQGLINQPQSPDVELIPHREKGKSRDKAAEKVGTNGKYVDIAEKLLELAPDLAEQVEQGNISILQAYRELIKRSKPEPPPLTGKYRVIYADPPWKYGNTMPEKTLLLRKTDAGN